MLSGSILAIDTGLSKTLTLLFLIYHQYIDLKQRATTSEKIVAKPTLVVYPAIII